MNTIVRSNRFNYNKEYKGPRFYTFSTWAHDITQYFMTSSGTVAVPVAFIALKLEKSVEVVKDMLESYFENKIAHYQKQITDTEDSQKYEDLSTQYAPLQYLFDGLELCEALKFRNNKTCKVIFGDISEQNFNGSFTDILCTIPHGAKLKEISLTEKSLIKRDRPVSDIQLRQLETVTYNYSLRKSVIDNALKSTIYFDRNAILDVKPLWDKDEDKVYYDIPSSDGNFILRFWTDYVEQTDGEGRTERVPRRYVEDVFGMTSTQGVNWKISEQLTLLSYYNDHIDIICKVNDDYNDTPEMITSVSIEDNQYKVKMVTGDIVPISPKNTNKATWRAYDKEELSHVLSIYPTELPIRLSDIEISIETYTDFVDSQGEVFSRDDDTLLGWTDLRKVYYDTFNIDSGVVTGKYIFDLVSKETACIQFKDTEQYVDKDKPYEFDFNCIIPLYKEYNRDSQQIEPVTAEQNIFVCGPNRLTPLGIWFNEELAEEDKYQEINVKVGNDSEKYTASWSLSISNQIKPYYASNSVPVNYADSKDIESNMQTFSGVLSKVQELGNVVKHLEDTIPHNVTDINTTQGLINRMVSSERMINLLSNGLTDKSRDLLQLRTDFEDVKLSLGSDVSEARTKVQNFNAKLDLFENRLNNFELTIGTVYQKTLDQGVILGSHIEDYKEFVRRTDANINRIDNELSAINKNIQQLVEWNKVLTTTQTETLKKLQVIETYWPIITMFVGQDSNAVKLALGSDTTFELYETPVGKSTANDISTIEKFLQLVPEDSNTDNTDINDETTEENS